MHAPVLEEVGCRGTDFSGTSWAILAGRETVQGSMGINASYLYSVSLGRWENNLEALREGP